MEITPKEIESIIKLDAFNRYQHFLKRVADTEKMYTLVNDNGDYAISGVDNHILIPFWPFPEYVDLRVWEKWEDYHPVEIDLDKFEDEVALLIKKHGYLLNIFPVDEKTGFVVTLDEFLDNLNWELNQYE